MRDVSIKISLFLYVTWLVAQIVSTVLTYLSLLSIFPKQKTPFRAFFVCAASVFFGRCVPGRIGKRFLHFLERFEQQDVYAHRNAYREQDQADEQLVNENHGRDQPSPEENQRADLRVLRYGAIGHIVVEISAEQAVMEQPVIEPPGTAQIAIQRDE